jgi:hypothetical protein
MLAQFELPTFFEVNLSPLWTSEESSLPTITINVESTDEAESLELVLRVLYRPWEDDAQSLLGSPQQLLGAFRLADEYQFPDGLIKRIADMLCARMLSMVNSLVDSLVGQLVDSVVEVYSLPLSLRERPSFVPLSSCGNAALQRLFRVAPAVITDAARLHEFLRLPFAAVLAWASDDHLIAHTENCVAYVLSAWARGPVGANASADELEALASSVRVGELRPSYLSCVLPLQPWFGGTRAYSFLPSLRVYLASFATAGWCGPPAWIRGARMRVLNSPVERPGNMDWTISPQQLVQLGGAPSTCIRSPSLYINGAFVRLAAAHHAVDGGGGVQLGVYVEVDVDAMRAALGELPEHAFVVAIRGTIEVRGTPALTINCVASRSFGYTSVFTRTTATTFVDLVAPYLEADGTLLVKSTLLKLE